MKAKSERQRVTVRLLQGEIQQLKKVANDAARSVGAQARVLILLGLDCLQKTTNTKET